MNGLEKMGPSSTYNFWEGWNDGRAFQRSLPRTRARRPLLFTPSFHLPTLTPPPSRLYPPPVPCPWPSLLSARARRLRPAPTSGPLSSLRGVAPASIAPSPDPPSPLLRPLLHRIQGLLRRHRPHASRSPRTPARRRGPAAAPRRLLRGLLLPAQQRRRRLQLLHPPQLLLRRIPSSSSVRSLPSQSSHSPCWPVGGAREPAVAPPPLLSPQRGGPSRSSRRHNATLRRQDSTEGARRRDPSEGDTAPSEACSGQGAQAHWLLRFPTQTPTIRNPTLQRRNPTASTPPSRSGDPDEPRLAPHRTEFRPSLPGLQPGSISVAKAVDKEIQTGKVDSIFHKGD